MKEAFIYVLVGLSSLAMLSYTVHMFLGGLVSERTETFVMVAVVVIAATVMGFLAWDVIRRRRSAGQ